MSEFKDMYAKAKKEYLECRRMLDSKGFDEILNPVHLHHAKKTFADENIKVCSAWRYSFEDVGYINVFVLCMEDVRFNPITRLYYSVSVDPILYGLRNWYIEGGSSHATEDAAAACSLVHYSKAIDIDRCIRQRFRHGTIKAHVRAIFQWVMDTLTGRK